MSQNPYLPPASDLNAGLVAPANARQVSAGFRFLAALADYLVYLFPVFTVAVLARRSYTYNHSPAGLVDFFVMAMRSTPGWVLLFAWLGVNAMQAYKIARTGQSLGKRILRMQIVRTDGQPAGFVHGVLVRCWLFYLLTLLLPFGLGGILLFVDGLFIFRSDRRCLHDIVADTRVKDLYVPKDSEPA